MIARDALPHPGALLVLNGTSSAGKTSLARELQRVLPTPYLHVQLDAFREMEPVGYFGREQSASAGLRVAALCRAIHATVTEYVTHGQNVILDHVLSPEAWDYLAEDLGHLNMLLVAVVCSAEETSRREASRPNRTAGLAASQLPSIHHNRKYDFTVETTHVSPSLCAEQVLRWLQGSPKPHAFQAAFPVPNAG